MEESESIDARRRAWPSSAYGGAEDVGMGGLDGGSGDEENMPSEHC